MDRRIKGFLGVMAVLADLALKGCVAGVVDLDDDWDHSGRIEVSSYFSHTLPVTGQLAFDLVGTNGTIWIEGVPGIQDVIVSGVRRVRSDSRGDAERALADLRVSTEVHSGGFKVETIQPKNTHGRTFIIDYEITLPVHLLVSVTSGNGAVQVQGVAADVAVANGNGDVTLIDVEGSSWVTLGNGDLSSDIRLPLGGEVFHTVGNGSLQLKVQPEVSAILGAEVGNGTITVSDLDLHQVTSTPRQIQGTLGAGDGVIDLAVGNGQIRVQGG